MGLKLVCSCRKFPFKEIRFVSFRLVFLLKSKHNFVDRLQNKLSKRGIIFMMKSGNISSTDLSHFY